MLDKYFDSLLKPANALPRSVLSPARHAPRANVRAGIYLMSVLIDDVYVPGRDNMANEKN